VELVVTIVIIGILASMGGMFISRPMEGYVDLKRRAELVDQAEMALRRMQRDIRAALPNSIRTFDGGKGIEFLHVVDGGRYRSKVDPDATPPAKQDNVLKFHQEDDEFEVLGGLQHFSDIDTENDFVVIYNLAASGNTANAYSSASGDNNIALLSTSSTAAILHLDSATRFPYSSPYQRFFIVDGAISYKIESSKLKRYSGYGFNNDPGPDSGGSDALVAQFIDAENSYFEYTSDTTMRSGLVSMRLTLEDDDESISLMHQVHVDNAP
jgi:MSHA biogenesis protein MshO